MALVHAGPGEKVHLPSVSSMTADGKTSAIVKTDRFEAVHLVLRSGKRIESHSVEGFITLHCLTGSVVVQANNNVEMRTGDWVYLDRGEQHALEAIEDSMLLLTVLFEKR